MKEFFLLYYKSLQVVETEFDSRRLKLKRSQLVRWASKTFQFSRKTFCLNSGFKFRHSVTENTDRVVTLVIRTQDGVSSNFGVKQSVMSHVLFSIPAGIFSDINFLMLTLQFIIYWSCQPSLLSERLVKRDVNNS
jgi:hypothetical protein